MNMRLLVLALLLPFSAGAATVTYFERPMQLREGHYELTAGSAKECAPADVEYTRKQVLLNGAQFIPLAKSDLVTWDDLNPAGDCNEHLRSTAVNAGVKTTITVGSYEECGHRTPEMNFEQVWSIEDGKIDESYTRLTKGKSDVKPVLTTIQCHWLKR